MRRIALRRHPLIKDQGMAMLLNRTRVYLRCRVASEGMVKLRPWHGVTRRVGSELSEPSEPVKAETGRVFGRDEAVDKYLVMLYIGEYQMLYGVVECCGVLCVFSVVFCFGRGSGP